MEAGAFKLKVLRRIFQSGGGGRRVAGGGLNGLSVVVGCRGESVGPGGGGGENYQRRAFAAPRRNLLPTRRQPIGKRGSVRQA